LWPDPPPPLCRRARALGGASGVDAGRRVPAVAAVGRRAVARRRRIGREATVGKEGGREGEELDVGPKIIDTEKNHVFFFG
jgi:hypothetical protein